MQEQEPATQRATAGEAPKLMRRAIDAVATVLGLGVAAIATVLLFEGVPLGASLPMLAAGLVLLPFIPIPGRGSRTTLFILLLGYSIVMPVYQSMMLHRQTQAALEFATATATQLAQAVVKDGQWPTAAAGFPDKLDPVQGDGFSHDVEITDCGDVYCTVLVRLTDQRYDDEIRGRSFGLWTKDGGKTWSCGSAGEPSVMPVDLPSVCRSEGSP